MTHQGMAQSQSGATEARVRPATPADCDSIASMCASLWPDSSAPEHAKELLPILEGKPRSTLPMTIFVAESAVRDAETTGVTAAHDTRLVGFVDVGLRSHADGCNTAHAVGFIEGWYVLETWRRQGVGAQLVATAEQWARAQGCTEMASDTWIANEGSQRAHEALGYEVVDRCVHYRKTL
jgi:aminoglycoside 6'-N-acetyltransferase I